MRGKYESQNKAEVADYIARIKTEIMPDWWKTYMYEDSRLLKPVYGYEWYKLSKEGDTK